MFEVLYEDEHVLVVNKPAGLVVHPGAGNPSNTLVNGLLHHRADLKALPRAGIVHRLDKDTSGVMVVAASPQAHQALSEAVAEREMAREYQAICEGRMIAGQDIDLPIGRDPNTRTRQAIREDGKPAYTSVRVETRFRMHTLVRATLETGRTHQIRVHAAHIGHALIGDPTYGGRRRLAADTPGAEDAKAFKRQALHAETLGFQHPVSKENLSFTALPPADMQALSNALRGL